MKVRNSGLCISLVATLTLAGCLNNGGGSGSGNSLTPLSDVQKNQIRKVSASIKMTNTDPNTGLLLTSQYGDIIEASCDVDRQIPPGYPENPPASGEVSWVVNGAGCPVALDNRDSWNETDTSYSGVGDWNYEVLDSDFYQYNDVIAYNFKVNSQSDSSNGYQSSASGTGTITSQAHGQIKYNISANGRADAESYKYSSTIEIQMADFTAVFKVNVTFDGTNDQTSYTLNDQEIPAEEFSSLLDVGGPAGGSTVLFGMFR